MSESPASPVDVTEVVRLMEIDRWPEGDKDLVRLLLTVLVEHGEEDFVRLIGLLDAATDRAYHLDAALMTLWEGLDRYRKHPVGEQQEVTKQEATDLTLKIAGKLCGTCAATEACNRPKGPQVTMCPAWREKVPECGACGYWMVNACMNANPCEAGEAWIESLPV